MYYAYYACTMLCGRAGASKSCAKTVLVKVYPRGNPEKAISVYAIIDEQSNSSLARSAFFYFLALSSCSEKTTNDSSYMIDLPKLIECD